MRIPRSSSLALSLTAAAALTLAACGDASSDAGSDPASGSTPSESADTVTIVDSQDRTVDVALNPETVVVTDWSAIRTLNDLGIEVDATPAAIATLPDDLAVYDGGEVPTVGDVFEPDYEAIEAMQPDLVIVGSRSGTPEVVAELEKFAPTVLDMSVRTEDPAQTLTETQERVTQIGSIFEKEAEAAELMDDLASQVEDLNTEISASGEAAMFVQVSDGTVGAYGPGSRFGTIYTDFGYASTDAPLDEEGSHGQEISQEFFVQYDPDVLYVLDRAKAVGQEDTPALDILNDGLVGDTTAATTDSIVEVDGFSWYLATSAPSSLQQMIDDVKQGR